MRRFAEQSHDGQRRGALAGARFANEPEHFAFVDFELDAAHCVRRTETDVEIAHLQQRGHTAIVAHGFSLALKVARVTF